MPNITFRGKIEQLHYTDGTPAPARIKVPKLSSAHFNREDFRRHPRFAALANSDLFLSALTGALRAKGIRETIRLDTLPEGVTVDQSGFLAHVTIEV